MNNDCSVTGTATTTSSTTTYTVSAVISGNTYTGTFSLQIMECTNSKILITRTYGTNAYYETFSVTDSTTQQVVLQVTSNSGQQNNEDWESFLCVSNAK